MSGSATGPLGTRSERAAGLLVDAAAVAFAWAMMLMAEDVAVGFLWRDQFSAAWEVTLARSVVVPMALAALAPLSIVAASGWEVARRAAAGSPASRRALSVLGAASMVALAIGVSQGRHFAAAAVRWPFVAALAALGGLFGGRLAARVAALEPRSLLLAALGLALAVGGWLADALVFPRLYPAFHVALAVASLLGGALVAFAARPAGRSPGPVARRLAGAMGVLLLLCTALVPNRARALDSASNLRIVLVEHAPMLGRVVAVATRLWPPPSDGPAAPSLSAPGEVVRALDWGGHDLLLLSVDALRADHVSAYGYARPTTPNIDALAREGARFESAYCPTPHTSYSITSMMTGKYLRPLMALGLGSDSETWAGDLRRYGWRTAAFYPPAVFYIDEDRFARFEETRLGFEYAKVEFADPPLREEQVAGYLEGAPLDRPLFLWVHFFEPHEPYVMHADHPFAGAASPEVDAYDSEVATADDGIGRILRLVRSRRPGAVVMVTADHGEEFGEHGGRYHGTTVYEEQVRVPLVVVGPGVEPGLRISTVVQTIDLLPTALSAVGIPRPARLRGRDLGAVLAGDAAAAGAAGIAFAETDDASLMASGDHRLVCERRAAACALYRPKEDPVEHHDTSREDPAAFARLRGLLMATVRDHGRYEGSGVSGWPEALRRGLQGDADAALDVAALLDDADVAIRRMSASLCFALRVPATVPAVKRALGHDEDDEVRRWCALALARMGEPLTPSIDGLLADADRDWRRRAALVLAERGEARACDEIAAWWSDVAPRAGRPAANGEPAQVSIDLPHAEELLAATGHARCRSAVGALLRSLDDVRARPYVADALGALGDSRASGPLLALFASEPYVTTRPHEALALLALGARDWASSKPETQVRVALPTARGAPGARLLVLVSDAGASVDASADGVVLASTGAGSTVRVYGLAPRAAGRVAIDVQASGGGIVALWMVPVGPDLIDRALSRK
jgi:arylsulfatase A-like enzyme